MYAAHSIVAQPTQSFFSDWFLPRWLLLSIQANAWPISDMIIKKDGALQCRLSH